MSKYIVTVVRHEIIESKVEIDADSMEDAVDRYCCDGDWLKDANIDCTHEEVTDIELIGE